MQQICSVPDDGTTHNIPVDVTWDCDLCALQCERKATQLGKSGCCHCEYRKPHTVNKLNPGTSWQDEERPGILEYCSFSDPNFVFIKSGPKILLQSVNLYFIPEINSFLSEP